MSDLAMHGERGSVFRPATVALLILVGLVGFFGMVVLGAYAPQLDQGGRTGSHAVSNGATGFSGLVRLADALGRNPEIVRNEYGWESEGLVVATPESGSTNLDAILTARAGVRPTLFVLPKWQVVRDPEQRGWVRVLGLLPAIVPEGVSAPGFDFTVKRHAGKSGRLEWPEDGLPNDIRFEAPEQLQVIIPGSNAIDTDADIEVDYAPQPIEPLLTDGEGGIVLGQAGNIYILSDPDLLNNAGMKSAQNAAAGIALLDWLDPGEGDAIGFDVVLNGLGGSYSLLRLAFDPPFLAMTLALAVTALMLGLRALGRFGAPARRKRALAFGKAALVDNSALLVRKAGKAHRLGGRYAAVVRDQAVRAFGVSPRFAPAEVDAYLDALGGEARYSELAQAAEAAHTDGQLLAAARALHSWKKERLGDN